MKFLSLNLDQILWVSWSDLSKEVIWTWIYNCYIIFTCVPNAVIYEFALYMVPSTNKIQLSLVTEPIQLLGKSTVSDTERAYYNMHISIHWPTDPNPPFKTTIQARRNNLYLGNCFPCLYQYSSSMPLSPLPLTNSFSCGPFFILTVPA